MMNSDCHGNQGDTLSSYLQKPMVKFQKSITDPLNIKWNSTKLLKNMDTGGMVSYPYMAI